MSDPIQIDFKERIIRMRKAHRKKLEVYTYSAKLKESR
jgi:hypothetical protein